VRPLSTAPAQYQTVLVLVSLAHYSPSSSTARGPNAATYSGTMRGLRKKGDLRQWTA
jgi:hypothetical protein